MNDQVPSSPRGKQRRLPIRWLSLAELVGVIALVIAGLGYWDQHNARLQQDRERAAAEQDRRAQARVSAVRQSFLMTGTPEGSRDLIRLAPVHPDQVIQTQTIIFPSQVRDDPVQTTGNPRIERGWFADGLKKAQRDRRREAKAGDEGRLPIGIVTVYMDGGEAKTDRAVYQLGYSLRSRLLRGAVVELDGLSLARRGVAGDVRAAVDGLWASSAPPAAGARVAPR